jgi:hypothetical protein
MSGITNLDLEREMLARILSLCASGHVVQVQFSDDDSFMDGKRKAEGTLTGEDSDKWEG